MPTSNSFSNLISSLKNGRGEAANELWERYAGRVTDVARKKLFNIPKRVADEEDVTASVFRSVFRGVQAGRLATMDDWDDIWFVLLAITHQKVVNHIRRETAGKRGGQGRENGTAEGADHQYNVEQLIANEPTPELVVMLDDEHQRLMESLRDDDLRQVATYRFEGYSVEEIALKMNRVIRTIERKLQNIREQWSEELDERLWFRDR